MNIQVALGWWSLSCACAIPLQGTLTGDISGTVRVTDVTATALSFHADMSGLGDTCDNATQHCNAFIDKASGACSAAKPNAVPQEWSSVTYKSQAGSSLVEDYVVTGVTQLSDYIGKRFLVYDGSGNIIGCTVLAEVQTSSKLEVEAFKKYPADSGRDMSATVTVHQALNEQAQILEFKIASGADVGCTPDAVITAANGCGIHIHKGSTCSDHSMVGGHHYSVSSDPWLKITYRQNTGFSVAVQTGLGVPDVFGRALVIHGLDGKRLSCGRIALPQNLPLIADGFGPYPGLSETAVSGSVKFGEAGANLEMFADIAGVDTECDGNKTNQNQCGVHIHQGSNCSDGGTVGGHYWTAVNGGGDPWLEVRFQTDNLARAVIDNRFIQNGHSLQESNGRVVIVHNSTGAGARVACAQLRSEKLSDDEVMTHDEEFEKYPGSDTTLVVKGQVNIHQLENKGQVLTYRLEGLDPICLSNFSVTAANGCGLHIHAGTGCDTAAGHHYDPDLPIDPWKKIRYVAQDSTGKGAGSTVAVPTNLSPVDINGRALVVHDSTGGRIACTLIQGASQDTGSTTPRSPNDGTTADPDDGTIAIGPALYIGGFVVVALLLAGGWYFMSQNDHVPLEEEQEGTELQ